MTSAAANTAYGGSSPNATGGSHTKASTLSRSLNNVRYRPSIPKHRKHPISLKQMQEDDQLYDRNEKSLENPMFAIGNLRKPYHMLDAKTKK